ncbi:MAG: 2,3-bisphosphoglycerate-independent phosphoglycerate mutase [Parcubacteria group bacterium GW2011_GWA2_46_9]|nr:MAG: 2,3-bisphosphoglycerate-independent phosphoglycerate mutase [Parcubacteria group bacterium GW2011_GWA2_46_9]
MSAVAIAERVVKEILAESYDFIVVNFANADMVGHTGNMDATIKAIEVLDQLLGQIADAVLAKEDMLLITSDHGNAEIVINHQTGEIDKEHNLSPVPFIAIANKLRGKTAGLSDTVGADLSLRKPDGVLADVAPTILKILELPIPPEMTGNHLL